MKRTNLIKARLSRHMTQDEVAQKLDISRTYYSNIENGTRRGTIDIWMTLQDLFDMNCRILSKKQPVRSKTERTRSAKPSIPVTVTPERMTSDASVTK